MDYSAYDLVDSFNSVTAAFLWRDTDPVPLVDRPPDGLFFPENTPPDVRAVFVFLITQAKYEVDNEMAAGTFDYSNRTKDGDVLITYRFSREKLRELAESKRQYPLFLFPELRGKQADKPPQEKLSYPDKPIYKLIAHASRELSQSLGCEPSESEITQWLLSGKCTYPLIESQPTRESPVISLPLDNIDQEKIREALKYLRKRETEGEPGKNWENRGKSGKTTRD